jgi:hypothetical protein
MDLRMSNIEEAVRAILRACAELSAAQAICDQDREQDTAPRDYAMRKVVEAFNRFAASAKASTKPLTIKITLSPTAK